LPIPEDGDVLATQSLHNEIRDYAAIVGMHAWSIGIENTHNLDIQSVLTVVVKEQRFGTTLALVVAERIPIGFTFPQYSSGCG